MGKAYLSERIKGIFHSNMNNTWQNLDLDEKMAALQTVARKRGIDERAVEKDWWVTVVLKALYSTQVAPHLNFKGGTSLSKGYSLIHRFSEDIDLSISRKFFLDVLGKSFAKAENNTQLKNLRKTSRDFIHEVLSEELKRHLEDMGVKGFKIRNHTYIETEKGLSPISHDSDPTVIFVDYESIFPSYDGDIQPRVKIEISCLSMDEPFEINEINTMLNEHSKEDSKFPQIDEELTVSTRTVTPSRTFLEKIFLLSEEFQKDNPRFRRMSRHLYDIEKIMDTNYGIEALANSDLYKKIIAHREKYYHLGYVDYTKDYPDKIDFVPSGENLINYKKDYEENMVDGYIYNDALAFEEIIKRLTALQNRIRQLHLN